MGDRFYCEPQAVYQVYPHATLPCRTPVPLHPPGHQPPWPPWPPPSRGSPRTPCRHQKNEMELVLSNLSEDFLAKKELFLTRTEEGCWGSLISSSQLSRSL